MENRNVPWGTTEGKQLWSHGVRVIGLHRDGRGGFLAAMATLVATGLQAVESFHWPLVSGVCDSRIPLRKVSESPRSLTSLPVEGLGHA